MLTLLHLSDLHFGSSHAFALQENSEGASKIAEVITSALDDNEIRVDHVIFTGDFFSDDQGTGYLQAKEGVEALKTSLGLGNENLSFVPGNHDKSWDPNFTKNPYGFYNELVNAFDRQECLQGALPSIVRISPESAPIPVFLALLDSCTVEGRDLAGIGNIGQSQLAKLKRKVQVQTKGMNNYVLIAALHHHLLPIYPVEKINDPYWPKDAPKGRSSHTLDAVDVLNRLSELNTALVIHGHQHRRAVISYQNRLSDHAALTIAASGSSGSRGDERQFYVYEIGKQDIRIRSFTQPQYDTSFTLDSHVNISIPLPDPITTVNRFCNEDAEIRRYAPAPSETSDGDSSDLHLVFLSVKDCDTSRNYVRRFVWNLPESTCNLHGMYDLLGRWDLLVRLRCPGGKFDDAALHKELIFRAQMEAEGVDFVDYQHINVLKETKSFKELLNAGPLKPIALERKVLGKTDDYDLKRCQRGFLYLRLPVVVNDPEATRREQEIMITTLARALDNKTIFRDIVDGIYRGKDDLVIETFMTCGQSQHLNTLNRMIEKLLKKFELQKYTMFCYGYDEAEIVSR